MRGPFAPCPTYNHQVQSIRSLCNSVSFFSGIFSSIVIQGAEAKGGGEGTGDVFETHAAGGVTRKGSAISSAKSTYSKSPRRSPGTQSMGPNSPMYARSLPARSKSR